MCVSVSVTVLVATNLVCMFKVRRHRLLYRLLKICTMWNFAENIECVCLSVCLSDTALAATYMVYVSKVRCHRIPCRVLFIPCGLC